MPHDNDMDIPAMKKEILSIMMCPSCGGDLLHDDEEKITCLKCSEKFSVVCGRPILLSENNNVFQKGELLASLNKVNKGKIIGQNIIIKMLIPSASVNMSKSVLQKYFNTVSLSHKVAKVLVIGSGQQKTILEEYKKLYSNIEIDYCDIDVHSIVDFYCDAHNLPLKSSVYDGIICTAVLEHTMYPEIAAQEISRVLKVGGFLYNELPFMQQVHEGAYDFTRYTLSGHRRLFNSFSIINIGLVAGPGTALVWSIENFFLSFFNNSNMRKPIKAIIRLSFFWIKYFDFMLKDNSQAIDSASCTFFFGRKEVYKVSDKDIIEGYIGSGIVKHIHI